jgi:hypothetical protein
MLRVQEVLVDRHELVAEDAVEMFDDFSVAFQQARSNTGKQRQSQ